MHNLGQKSLFGSVLIIMVAFLILNGCEASGLSDSNMDWGGDGDGDTDIDGDSDSDSDEDDTDSEDDTDTDDCDDENQVILYLSADDSNSMAGPAFARAVINEGLLLRANIRTYEYLNYYNFDYAAASAGHLNVSAQMRMTEVEGSTPQEPVYSLQIGVRAPDQSNDERRPLNITLSLDTSGSMAGNPIDLVQASCKALAGSMRNGDIISIVKWSSSQTVVLESHSVTGANDSTVVAACDSLEAAGSTDLHGGLVRAYELARENFSASRINRVIMMSDGGANTGITDEQLIADEADDANGEAIYMMGVGMSESSGYNDSLMDTVTDAGKGAYIFIDSEQEAQKMFGERFLSITEVAARDVQVELTLPPTFEMFKFFGEEYSGDPQEVEPQHLSPNDAMIFNQLISSCDASVVSSGDVVRVAALWKDPVSYEEKIDSLDTTIGDLLEGDSGLLIKGNAIVAYAETLKALRDMNPGQATLDLIDETREIISNAFDALGEDPDLGEIYALLTAYRERFL